MFFRVSNNLVTGGAPVFLGLLEKFSFPDLKKVLLTVDDIETILFSLSIKNTDTLGEYSRYLGSTPVEEFQNRHVDKMKAITEPKYYENELYTVLGLEPFESNFMYIPPNDPVLLEKPGIYEARFDIIDVNGDFHPAKVEVKVGMTVR